MLKRILIALLLFASGNIVIIAGAYVATQLYAKHPALANTIGIGGAVIWMLAMVGTTLIFSALRPSRA